MTAVAERPAPPSRAGRRPRWRARRCPVLTGRRRRTPSPGPARWCCPGTAAAPTAPAAARSGPLSAEPPDQPATVFVYDPAAGTGRALVCDFDTGKAQRRRRPDPPAAVAADAAAFAALVTQAGGRCLEDVSPSGGRHVYVLWERPQPWLQLKQLAQAAARRFTTLDLSPVQKLTGLIRPPGSRYKLIGHRSPGWQLLTTPGADVRDITARRCGPEVWNALHAALASELQACAASPDTTNANAQPGGTRCRRYAMAAAPGPPSGTPGPQPDRPNRTLPRPLSQRQRSPHGGSLLGRGPRLASAPRHQRNEQRNLARPSSPLPEIPGQQQARRSPPRLGQSSPHSRITKNR